jgi:parvulin-like peptidyl-prolyl isomerase
MKATGAARAVLSAAAGIVMLLSGVPAHPRVIDGVVALVNDEPITYSEVREEVAGGLGMPVGDADVFLREQRDAGPVLRWVNVLVEAYLVRAELKRKGEAVSEKEVDRAIENVRRSNRVDEAQFAELLAREGITLPAFRNRIRAQLERGAIIRDRKLKEVTVTEVEVRDYFRESAERFLTGGEVRLEMLFFPLPPEDAGKDAVTRVRFAAHQASESIGPGRPLSDGLEAARVFCPDARRITGDFVPEEDLMAGMRREVGRLRSGERSEPFAAGDGLYIVRVLERRGGKPREFQEVKASLTEELTDRRSEKALVDIIQELKKSASIDVWL